MVMSAFAGKMEFLPEFSGIATASSVAKFWKVYRAKGQAAYAKLQAWTLEQARIEARYLRLIRLLMIELNLAYQVALDLVSSPEIPEKTRKSFILRALRRRHQRVA